MDERVRVLLDRSFHHCPGVEANAQIARIRGLYLVEFGRAFGYEVVLPADAPWVDRDLLPRFAHHLSALKLSARACAPMFIAAFCGETLYFLRSTDFVDHLLAEEHLTFEDVPARVEAWKRAQAAPRRLLALPAPDEGPTGGCA
jgi:hypothetical protein